MATRAKIIEHLHATLCCLEDAGQTDLPAFLRAIANDIEQNSLANPDKPISEWEGKIIPVDFEKGKRV